MRNFLTVLFLSSVVLTACGGGSVQISPLLKEKRPAYLIVQNIETLSGSELATYIQDLHGPKGDELDWEEFWRLLGKSPKLNKVLAEHHDSLLTLSARSCDYAAYKSFAAFLNVAPEGQEYLYSAARKCETSVPPDLLKQFILTTWVRATPDLKLEIADDLIALLDTEIKKYPESSWLPLGREFEAYLGVMIATAMKASQVRPVAELLATHRQVSGRELFPELMLSLLFSSDDQWNLLLFSRPQVELTQTVWNLLPTHPKGIENLQVTELQAEQLLERITEDPFDSIPANWAIAWTHFLKIAEILDRMELLVPTSKRLQFLSDVIQSFIKWHQSADYYSKFVFEKQLSADVEIDNKFIHAAFLTLLTCLEVDQEKYKVLLRDRFRNISPSSYSGLSAIVLGLIRLRLSDQADQISTNLNNYCQLLRLNGAQPVQRKKAASFNTTQPEKLEVGCYEVETKSKDSLRLPKLTSTLFSVLSFPKAVRLAIKSNHFDVHNLVLSLDPINGATSELTLQAEFVSPSLITLGYQVPGEPISLRILPFELEVNQ